jgi:hypothetical protein
MKKIERFISNNEKEIISSFVNDLNQDLDIENKHIKSVASKLKGKSYMFDITKTEISNKLSVFQSSNNLVNKELPDIFYELLERISNSLKINKENVFLQILNQDSGGLIHPHYDSSIDGYITYKCNICIQSDDYELFLDKDILEVKELDLYCFEASLYKHWTNPFKRKRIILSWGFILPYQDLNRNENDPRVRLSKRIVKYFQN